MATFGMEESSPPQQHAQHEDDKMSKSNHPVAAAEDVTQPRSATEITTSSTTNDASTLETANISLSSTIPVLLLEHDNEVFGTLNRDLTDCLAESARKCVTVDIMKGLPLLEEGLAKNELQNILVHKFFRNIDVLENYSEKNVLTLRKFALATRKRIIRVLRHGDDALEEITARSMRMDKEMEDFIPTKDVIITERDSKSLQNELELLQTQLKASRTVRNDLLVERRRLERAQAMMTRVFEASKQYQPMVHTTDKGSSTIQQQVHAKVIGGNSIHEMTNDALMILDHLDSRKRQRDEAAKNIDPLEEHVDSFFPQTISKKPRPSLEEIYQSDRKQLGLLRDSTNHCDGRGNKDGNNNVNGRSDTGGPAATLLALKNLLKSRPAK